MNVYGYTSQYLPFASYKETERAIRQPLYAGLNECEMEIRQNELPISGIKTGTTNTISFIHLGLAFHQNAMELKTNHLKHIFAFNIQPTALCNNMTFSRTFVTLSSLPRLRFPPPKKKWAGPEGKGCLKVMSEKMLSECHKNNFIHLDFL